VPDFHTGSVFAGHRIEGVAGRGGMGIVYRATQLALDRTVALKLIAPELADDPGFRARFVAESKAAASIEHPNVLPIYYAEEREGLLYIAMRFVDGADLRRLLRAEGALEPRRAARIVDQVASALDAAHERGLVHRDVKPANVLLGPRDHAYLTDFGLTKAVAASSAASRTKGWVGTLGYIAPEQIRGERVDARADVYALACVLFHALAGRPPYGRDSDEATLWDHLNEPPPSVGDHVPRAFDAVLRRGMAKDPADRYPSAGDLGRAALAAAGEATDTGPERRVAVGAAAPAAETRPAGGDDGAEARTEALPGARPPRRGRHRARLAAALAGLALAGGAAVVLLTGGDPARPRGQVAQPTPTPRRPAEPHVVRTVAVGERPNDVVVSRGTVWVSSSRSTVVMRIDAATGRVQRPSLRTGRGVKAMAAGFGSLWVLNFDRATVTRYSLRTRRRLSSTPVPSGRPNAIALAAGAVWVGTLRRDASGEQDAVLRLDPRSGRVLRRVAVPAGVGGIDAGRSAVWVVNRTSQTVTRLDIRTAALTPVPVGRDVRGIAVGVDAVWATSFAEDAVTRIDPRTLRRTTVPTGGGPTSVAAAPGTVWVVNNTESTLTRIDPATRRRVGEPVPVALNPFAIDVAGRSLWVTSIGEDRAQRVDF
jgi:streptogramin lyase